MKGDTTVLRLVDGNLEYRAGPAALDLGLRRGGLLADARRRLDARQGKWRERKIASGDAKRGEQG